MARASKQSRHRSQAMARGRRRPGAGRGPLRRELLGRRARAGRRSRLPARSARAARARGLPHARPTPPASPRPSATMVVRGAPAIGIAAAYGMALAARAARDEGAASYVAAMRAAGGAPRRRAAHGREPRVGGAARDARGPAARRAPRRASARASSPSSRATIHREDVAACQAMGRVGARAPARSGTVLTHCNAGALATGGYGTALGVIRAADRGGQALRVLACETRPYLQGARLTAWELREDGIPVEVITDSMAAHFMQTGRDRRRHRRRRPHRANGDVANKIGTYGLAASRAPRRSRSTWPPRGARSISPPPTARRSRSRSGAATRSPSSAVGASSPTGVASGIPAFDVTPADARHRDLHRARQADDARDWPLVAAGERRPASATWPAVTGAPPPHGLRTPLMAQFSPKPDGSRSARPGATPTTTSRRRSASSTSTRSARRRAARTSASAGARAPRR